MNKEIKEQAHKEFDEKFTTEDWSGTKKLNMFCVSYRTKESPIFGEDEDEIVKQHKSFLDSLIDKTISDYQTNYEQKHIASALEVERKKVASEIKQLALDAWLEAQTLKLDAINAVTTDVDLDKMGKILLDKLNKL